MIKKKNTSVLYVRLEPKLRKLLENTCEKERRTLQAVVVAALEYYLGVAK